MFSAEYKESSFLSNPASISKSSTFSWPRSVKETFLLFSSMMQSLASIFFTSLFILLYICGLSLTGPEGHQRFCVNKRIQYKSS